MPRFVILEHDSPRNLHWDLMLEYAGTLRTWALVEPPTTAHPVAADALADHRIAYLDYEGQVSGDRGTVTRWDRGEYQPQRWSVDNVEIIVVGQMLRGSIYLARENTAVNSDAQRWSLRFISASSV